MGGQERTLTGSNSPGDSGMTQAVIVSTARTALAKSGRGTFNNTHGITMGAHALKHAMDRSTVDPADVEDVVFGAGYPEGATGFNVGRNIAMAAGCPTSTSGMTVNRYCRPLQSPPGASYLTAFQWLPPAASNRFRWCR
jgi:acetyl-CoA C-acetyltransferase